MTIGFLSVLLCYLLVGHRLHGFEYQLVEQDAEGLYGVVQVKRADTWGTVCARGYDERDAKVICRSLNLSDSDARPLERHYGTGPQNVSVVTLECTGEERSLAECPGVNQTATLCPTSMMALVYCAKAWSFKLRLTGSGILSAGLAQIYYFGEWGTIQSKGQYSDPSVAKVFCKSLGFPYKMSRRISGTRATGRVRLRDVQCFGNETDLLKCRYEVVPLSTEPDSGTEYFSCEDLRSRAGEGLTGFFKDEWRPVFSEDFNDLAASVACRVMGLQRTGARVVGAKPDLSGAHQRVLSVGRCTGYERTLLSCRGSGWVRRTTGRIDIKCARVDTSRVKFQLADSVSGLEGRLEIFQGHPLGGSRGYWGTVCDDGITQATVRVACRTLNLPSTDSARVIRTDYVGEGTGRIVLHDLTCLGNESSLLECDFNPFGVGRPCYHSQDLSIYCGIEPTSGDYRVKLVDGEDENSGRVEISMYGIWNRLCDYTLSDYIAKVVCRQLGRPSVAAKSTECFDEGTNKFWVEGFSCDGDEYSVDDCSRARPTISGCTALRVICSDTDVDDYGCFETKQWVYVVIVVSVVVALIIALCVAWRIWKKRRRRTDASRRHSSMAVRYTVSVIDSENRQARAEIEMPPPYSEPPPSYDVVMRKETTE